MKSMTILSFALFVLFSASAMATPIYCGVNTVSENRWGNAKEEWKPKGIVTILPDNKEDWTRRLDFFAPKSDGSVVNNEDGTLLTEKKEARAVVNYFDMFAPGDPTEMSGLVIELDFKGLGKKQKKTVLVESAIIRNGTFKEEIKIYTGVSYLDPSSELPYDEFVSLKCWSEEKDTE